MASFISIMSMGRIVAKVIPLACFLTHSYTGVLSIEELASVNFVHTSTRSRCFEELGIVILLNNLT